MRLPLIVGCLVLSACAANPPAPAAKSGDAAATKVAGKTPARPAQICDSEQPRTGSILSTRRCRKPEQAGTGRDAAQDARSKPDQTGGS